MGLRFRKNVRDLPGKPDIVFPTRKVAVFCDGDFWHGRKWRSRRRKLQRGPNSQYWVKKISTNIARDRKHDRQLRRLGWAVLRFWETEILDDPTKAATEIADVVRSRNGSRRARDS